MKTITKLNQAGDTIIEVLIVLAILGLSFGISYATASKSLNASLNAEQHSEALGIIDSQIEELRQSIANGSTANSPSLGYFCMNGISGVTALPGHFIQDEQQDLANGYTEYGSTPYTPGSGCKFGTNSIYNAVITAASPVSSRGSTFNYSTPVSCSAPGQCNENSYTVLVRWAGVGVGLGPQQESLTYRMGFYVPGSGDYSSGQ